MSGARATPGKWVERTCVRGVGFSFLFVRFFAALVEETASKTRALQTASAPQPPPIRQAVKHSVRLDRRGGGDSAARPRGAVVCCSRMRRLAGACGSAKNRGLSTPPLPHTPAAPQGRTRTAARCRGRPGGGPGPCRPPPENRDATLRRLPGGGWWGCSSADMESKGVTESDHKALISLPTESAVEREKALCFFSERKNTHTAAALHTHTDPAAHAPSLSATAQQLK